MVASRRRVAAVISRHNTDLDVPVGLDATTPVSIS
jgi:hypothetical protein